MLLMPSDIAQCAENLLSDLHLGTSVSIESVKLLDIPPEEKATLLENTKIQNQAERKAKMGLVSIIYSITSVCI